ncbi:hypothetical protein [Sporosarcina sp. ZBG7A]|uniref:hypothetical protein n=1 Tax=Sporosarcina sp. ZBG7A TaxID=1582223 RepID=UPI000579E098|nr:hypothetical protein [Sporosarcina sp. ZBG7A]
MANSEDLPENDQSIDFFVPKSCCPERLKTPQFPSPESCLPPDMMEKVEEKIVEANLLLLDLALEDDRSVQETYQKVFDGLIGLDVELMNTEGEIMVGRVVISAFDFVLLRHDKHNMVVPHNQINLVKPSGRYAEPFPDADLVYIDPYLRRKLTFQFGKVVASSPELIQLFFRIPLAVYLLLFEGKLVKIVIEETLIEGILMDVNKESIVLKSEEEKKVIPIEKIGRIILDA